MKRILIVHGAGPGLASAAAALAPLNAEVVEQRTLEGLSADSSFDLAIVNYDALTSAERAGLIVAFPRVERRTQLIAASGGDCRPDFAELFGRGTLVNLLALNTTVDEEDLRATARKLLDSRIFGLEHYVACPRGEATLKIVDSRQRGATRETAHTFAIAQGASRRLASTFCDALDELLTNAIYNGPRGADSAPRWVDRETEVTLGEAEAISVRLVADERRLAVSVHDPFGSLSPKQVLDYLAKCFRQGEDQLDTKEGGAGLGLYYVFEHCSHFALNIAPQRMTEAIGLVELKGSFRGHAGRAKSFNLFLAQ